MRFLQKGEKVSFSMEVENGYRKLCKRFNIKRHAHELTFSCYKNKPLLKSKTACEFLAEAIERFSVKYQFKVWAYVFMPNHVHLLIFPTAEDYNISKILQSIKLSVSKRMINYIKHNYPESLSYLAADKDGGGKYLFWQEGVGYDRNIYNKKTAENSINYIHQNPLKKELAETLSDWHYLSYKQWQNMSDGPVKINRNNYFSR